MIFALSTWRHTKCHKISPLNAGCKIIFMFQFIVQRKHWFLTASGLRHKEASAEKGLCGSHHQWTRKTFAHVSKGERELSKGVVERRTSTESALKIGQNHKLPFLSRSSGRCLQLPAVV